MKVWCDGVFVLSARPVLCCYVVDVRRYMRFSYFVEEKVFGLFLQLHSSNFHDGLQQGL